MQRQITAAVLSILLLNTLALEHAKKLQHSEKKLQNRQHLLSRSLPETEQCLWYCPEIPGENFKLELTVNVTTKLMGIVNVEAGVAVALDVSNSILLLFNGTSTGYLAVNLTSGIGVYFKSSETSWNIKTKFSEYINSQSSFTALLAATGGVFVSIDNEISEDIRVFIVGVLSNLSSTYAINLKTASVNSLFLIVELSRTVIQYRITLIEFFKLSRDVTTKIVMTDLVTVFAVFQGLGYFGIVVDGGIAIFLEKQLYFDLSYIANANNGVDVLIYLIRVIKTKFSVNAVLGNILRNNPKLLDLINQFNGNTGLSNVLFQIVSYLHGTSTIDVFLASLTSFAISSGNSSLAKQWNASFAALFNVTREIDNCCLREIAEHNWIVNKANISEIIIALYREQTVSGMDLAVNVLVLLKSVIPIQVSIPYFTYTLIQNLKTETGVAIVNGLDSNLAIPQSGSMLQTILRRISIVQIISSKNLFQLFSSFAVIGQIFISINKALIKSGGPALEETFSSSNGSKILYSIKNLFVNALKSSEFKSTTPSGGHHYITLYYTHKYKQGKHQPLVVKSKHAEGKHHKN